jgi:hypothetical protein
MTANDVGQASDQARLTDAENQRLSQLQTKMEWFTSKLFEPITT